MHRTVQYIESQYSAYHSRPNCSKHVCASHNLPTACWDTLWHRVDPNNK